MASDIRSVHAPLRFDDRLRNGISNDRFEAMKKQKWTPFIRFDEDVMRNGPRSMHRAYRNNLYIVMVYQQETEWGLVEDAMVQQINGKPFGNWRDMQRIKNEIFGEHRTAIEIYPPDSEVVDDSNIYHLWVLPEDMTLPCGLQKSFKPVR